MDIQTMDAADDLGISDRYVRQLAARGSLTKSARGRIDSASIQNFKEARRHAGRPPQSSDALALMLHGQDAICPPRTLARLKNAIRNEDAYTLAKSLLLSTDKELSSTARTALTGDFLSARRAQQYIHALQLKWISNNPTKLGSLIPLALTGMRSTATIGEIVSEEEPDLALRIASDHVSDLIVAPPGHIQALIHKPAEAKNLELNILLTAGAAWAARLNNLPTPEWTLQRSPHLLWAEYFADEAKWIPEFKERNMYATPSFFTKEDR